MLRMTLALCLGLAAATACGAPSATRPLGAVDAYARALESGDFDRAYDLMSDHYRKEHSRDDFVKMMRESPRDVKETAERLKSGKRDVDVRATYVYDDLRDEMILVEEGGAWRIDSNPLDYYPQDTPRAALRSFIRAVELKRWDVLVRFVPKAYAMSSDQLRGEFEGERAQEIADLLRKLKAALDTDSPIQVEGDEARLQYGDRAEIIYKREDGSWKIDDFQ
jgi:hypothetical protein